MMKIRPYFKGVSSRPKVGTSWMDVRIEHDTKFDDVQKEANQYLQEKCYTIWKKSLQYSNTRRTGFLE